MPIDRDDDADPPRMPGKLDVPERPEAPERPERPERPEAPGARDIPDLRERQLAEHARYERLVDATFAAAAREKWAAAAPEFRAAWEEHKQRYPQRERETARSQPDGSWLGDGNRRLSPEQNAEAAKCCADLRDEGSEVILPAMRRVEVADPERHLAGLEHMLKGEDRIKEKIADTLRARPELTATQALSIVPDPVRFTLSYPSERYAEGVLADVERLKSEGFELIKLKNLWHADQYKGANSQWRSPGTGTRFEMQFHTPESREAKELTHEAYERLRSGGASPAERPELEAFQRRVNRLITTPPGAARIKDFPGE